MIEHVPFYTIREDYNEYVVENGQILRVKHVIMDVYTEDKDGRKMAGISFNEVSHVNSPPGLESANLEYAEASTVTEKDEVKELHFKTVREIINVYETTKSIILTAPQVEKISLTNKKDKLNAPYLRYRLVTNVNIVDKPKVSESSHAGT